MDAAQTELDPGSQGGKGYGDNQARRRGGQRLIDAATELSGVGPAFGSRHGAESFHHAEHGSQQTEQWRQGCDDFNNLEGCLERLERMLRIPRGGFPNLAIILAVLNGLNRIGDKPLQRIHLPPSSGLMSNLGRSD